MAFHQSVTTSSPESEDRVLGRHKEGKSSFSAPALKDCPLALFLHLQQLSPWKGTTHCHLGAYILAGEDRQQRVVITHNYIECEKGLNAPGRYKVQQGKAGQGGSKCNFYIFTNENTYCHNSW